ncbi:DUF1365 domain-containing protein [Hoyosella rhizosphaerae]|uniref:DUF1365 domain-containing protein n=1 Tax=Hoyosella rhizosphaerae TaxID=1755582 RepID=A0A916TYJ0_9ACTN|nr:DUF1365 domain-containing protein [Hoyosella rhizosphaerae]MBN4927274.1 DUF1365 domain-containing protein [Hoyosella rhizosphaerae]GGC52554.1 DUF1365 domain-containing protein [Hoyosella rhizosphaerae]
MVTTTALKSTAPESSAPKSTAPETINPSRRRKTYPGAIYHTQIRHVRRAPLRNVFTYRSMWWLVDLDRIPVLPWWARPFVSFQSKDHFGDPHRSIRDNVEEFLALRGIDISGGSVWMLANARAMGINFNPLSVYWCFDRHGDMACVIAEVHNTYGEKHCYVVGPDAATAGARVDKEFYVSPFNDVSGEYQLRLPAPTQILRLAIVLHRTGQPPFTATVTGVRQPITVASVVRAISSIPLPPLRVIVQIRWQGVRLWLRRLPVVPRPKHQRQEGV